MVVLLCQLFKEKYSGLKVPLHLLGLDCRKHFFSRVGGMTGYERNYDFEDLIHSASGLNRLAAMEYGEENVFMGRGHARQQTIWRNFIRLVQISEERIAGNSKPLILLNMAPHTGVRNQVWWKTPWVNEIELGLFHRGSEVALDPVDDEGEGFEGELGNSNAIGDLWDIAFPVQREGSDSEQVDDINDLTVLCHETRHVMSEVLQQISSEDQEVKKYNSMVVYDGHAIYKTTLVSQLVGNPTLSKDRLTRIKHIFQWCKAETEGRGCTGLYFGYRFGLCCTVRY
ncbi:hypothetical protein R1sor_003210 [Riccia sorocarpa]|uniref:Uncharacterized protein n=1 Tax=Riccia sorocarpa TaxID=122646 RepID=A0ABD3H0X5_9MARC